MSEQPPIFEAHTATVSGAPAVLGRQERELVVVCPPGSARRIFEMAGIVDLLELFDSPEDAAASLSPWSDPRLR